MKKIKIFVSNSMLSSFDQMVESLKDKKDDLYSSNIIIIPDKFSLNAERRVFDVLNLESTFNIDVMSFNRLAYKILSGKDIEVMSKRKGIMIVNKLLIENKDNLQSFNKLYSSNGLAENVYETIMQFKSSGIQPNELTTNKENLHLTKKLQDLALIYNLYEKHFNDKVIDESNRLKLLANRIITSSLINKSNIFIGMFDSFTYLQMQVIKQLMKYANEFSISISANTVQNNSHIYVNETLMQIVDLCRANNYEYEIINNTAKDSKEQEKICRELFSIKDCEQLLTNNINIYKAENFSEEINFVAKKIKELVILNSYNYSDFNIAFAGLEKYKDDIERIFNTYNIPFYIDSLSSYSNNFVIKFIISLCETYFSNLSKNSVMEFIKYDFINFKQEIKDYFENYCKKYGIERYKFNYPFKYDIENEYHIQNEEFRKYIISFLNNFKEQINNAKNSYQYSQVLVQALEKLNVKENIEKYLVENDLDIIDKKNLQNIYDKILAVAEEINSVLGETEIDFNVYYEILINVFNNETFSNIPLKVNSVFIGDASSSYFYKEKVLFVMNATEGELPVYKNDCGIITDNEILKLNAINILNPSIKQINKREKFKVFNLLANFNEKLFVTYSCLENGQEKKASEVIIALQKIFKGNINLDKNIHFDLLTDIYGFEKASVINYGNIKNIIKDDIKYSKDSGIKLTEKDCLNDNNLYKAINHKNEYYLKNDNIKHATKRTSVSRVENFNSCPFKFFCQYVLKIKENEDYGMRVLDIGNILHSVAEKFVDYYISSNFNIKEQEIRQNSDKFFNETISQLELDYLDKNSIQIVSLQEESYKLCKIIIYQAQNSKFKPFKAEYSFDNYKLTDDVVISGKIDRVDVFEDYFNIIDYKTGKDRFSFADIFTGKKLQIIIYCYILEQLTKKHCFGCFYMPVTNDFAKQEDDKIDKYKLSGVILHNEALIKSMDTKLETENKSDIINVVIKKDGDFHSSSLNKMLSHQEYEAIKQYAIDMLIKTNENIKSGNYQPSPLGAEMCKYCDYSSICNYNLTENGYRERPKNITKKVFTQEAQDE